MKTAFLFSGQGDQTVGMGKDFYENFECAEKVFNEADEALGFSIRDIAFNNKEELDKTENTQPAILTMSIAALRILEEKGIKADYVAGLSLGEYSALVASGVFDFKEAVQLVTKRGKFMAEAVPNGVGGMCAILGLEDSEVEVACEEASSVGCVSAVNYNAPGQLVISGENAAVDKAAEICKKKGAKMTVKLTVSGPFHTKLLKPASDKLGVELAKMQVNEMNIPVVSNVTGNIIENKEDIVPLLTKQVMNPVKWKQSIELLGELGVDTFIEIGPGRSLSGFVKRILKNVTIINVKDMKSLENALKKLEK